MIALGSGAPKPGSPCLMSPSGPYARSGERFAAFAANFGESPADTISSDTQSWIALSPDASLDLRAEDLAVHLMTRRWVPNARLAAGR